MPKKKIVEVERKFKPITAKDLTLIDAPVITEKSQAQQTNLNKMTFVVSNKNSNKAEIKLAVEALFNVKVEKVNIITVAPRAKKMGKHSGFVKGYKKAICTLNKDEKLSLDDAA